MPGGDSFPDSFYCFTNVPCGQTVAKFNLRGEHDVVRSQELGEKFIQVFNCFITIDNSLEFTDSFRTIPFTDEQAFSFISKHGRDRS